MSDAVPDVLWQRAAARSRSRLRDVERWVEGGPVEPALVAAHQLAGSLGTYGRHDGSVAAARLEELLVQGAAPDATARDLLDRVRLAIG